MYGVPGMYADVARLEVHAEVVRRHVEQPGRAARTRRAAGSFRPRGSGRCPSPSCPATVILLGSTHGTSRLEVDARRPVHRHVRLARGAPRPSRDPSCSAKPLRSKWTSALRVVPPDRQVDEDVLVHRVVVPHVVRRRLERPHHLAGVGVARDDRARSTCCRPGAARRSTGRGSTCRDR